MFKNLMNCDEGKYSKKNIKYFDNFSLLFVSSEFMFQVSLSHRLTDNGNIGFKMFI